MGPLASRRSVRHVRPWSLCQSLLAAHLRGRRHRPAAKGHPPRNRRPLTSSASRAKRVFAHRRRLRANRQSAQSAARWLSSRQSHKPNRHRHRRWAQRRRHLSRRHHNRLLPHQRPQHKNRLRCLTKWEPRRRLPQAAICSRVFPVRRPRRRELRHRRLPIVRHQRIPMRLPPNQHSVVSGTSTACFELRQ